jgi:hypothetical protein
MTESPKHPKPQGNEVDALYDARWDIVENGAATLHPDDPEKWLYWLHRYEGFGEEELEVKQNDSAALIIGYRD